MSFLMSSIFNLLVGSVLDLIVLNIFHLTVNCKMPSEEQHLRVFYPGDYALKKEPIRSGDSYSALAPGKWQAVVLSQEISPVGWAPVLTSRVTSFSESFPREQ